MVIVVDEYRPKVGVVANMPRPMDDHGPVKATGVLRAVMAVVPGRSIKIGLEAVGKGRVWRDGTLVYGRDAVVPRRLRLQQSVVGETSVSSRHEA